MCASGPDLDLGLGLDPCLPCSELCFEITEEKDRFYYDKEDILESQKMGMTGYVVRELGLGLRL